MSMSNNGNENGNENECRICFELETLDDPFIYPCNCKGTSKYVHKSCLNSWRTLNTDNEAFNICMECRGEYDIINEFPKENIKLFFCCKKMIQSYCINYLISSTLGTFIWIIEDYNNDYIFLKFMSGNFENDTKLISIIKQDSIAPQIFYFSFAIFIQNIVFYLFFLFKVNQNIHRKKIYFKKMRETLVVCISITFSFLIFFYILKDNFPILLLNIISFFSVVEPLNGYLLLKNHNKVVKWLNDNNPETLRNYQVHNPSYGLENNVVINNTDNVLYQSLTTDSSESESSDNIQSLNIIIEN
jgi:hypothetical protein